MILMLLDYGCSSSSTFNTSQSTTIKSESKTEQETSIIKEQKKTFYLGVYQDNNGIKYFNNVDGTEKLILEISHHYGQVKQCLTPQKDKIAFSFYDSKKDETNLYVLILSNQKLVWLKKNPGFYQVNLFWDNDSLLYCNFYSSKQNKQTKLWDVLNGYTELINVFQNKVVQNIKPKKGAVIEAYLQNKFFVFSDYEGFYIVEKGKNKLLKTLKNFNTKDKKNISFSPDGKKFFYIERRKVVDQFGEYHTLNELRSANYDGTKDETIISYSYNPQNVKWSPNSDKISCDVASEEWSNIRHLCFYDLLSNKATFKTKENYGRIPSFTDCFWSPSGNSVLVRSEVETQLITHKSYFIRDLYSGIDNYIRDAGGNVNPLSIGVLDNWWEEDILIFGHVSNYTVYDSKEKTFTYFPSNRWILYLKKI